jgi:D-alanyl-D-alanine carboxypeptidase
LAGFGAVKTFEVGYNLASKMIGPYFANNDEPENLQMGGPAFEEEVAEIFYPEDIDIEFRSVGYSLIDPEAAAPNISTEKYMITDLDTGEVIDVNDGLDLIQRKQFRDVSVPIASISKLITALVVSDNMNIDEDIKIGWDAVATYGQQGDLYAGQVLNGHDLLAALLLTSSNDAAEAFAIEYGRDEFMDLMNQKAQDIGMKNTFFDDPSGLSADNQSSLHDLSILGQYLYKYYPEILDITKQKSHQSGRLIWYNSSRFRNDDSYLGGKNGYTDEANNTLISMFELPLGTDSQMRNISIVLLGSDSAEKDMRAIILYLLRNVEYVI